MPMSSSSSSLSSPSLHTFSTPPTLKLNDENFLAWRQQILAQVEGLDLLHFLTSCSTPPNHLTPGSGSVNPSGFITPSGSVNPAYLLHKQQVMAMSWSSSRICDQRCGSYGLKCARSS